MLLLKGKVCVCVSIVAAQTFCLAHYLLIKLASYVCIIICMFVWLGHSELIQNWKVKGIEGGVRFWTVAEETRLLIIAYRDGERGRKEQTEWFSYMAASNLGEKGLICHTASCIANRFVSVWIIFHVCTCSFVLLLFFMTIQARTNTEILSALWYYG